jgi:hypothetical protein
MKRSRTNAAIREAIEFLEECRFRLPPFAFWTPADWRGKGHECDEIRDNMLGWDITDFGLGDYERAGVLLFTLRNGSPADPAAKPYCEKIIITRPEQRCLMHFHWQKVEDIINRAGGDLVIELYGSRDDGEPDREGPLTVSLDGVERRLPAGGRVTLSPGESICLTQGLYHEFWAEGGTVLIGEVSAVNDDTADNRFAEEVGRFPEIEEDEPALHYLCNEYPPAD